MDEQLLLARVAALEAAHRSFHLDFEASQDATFAGFGSPAENPTSFSDHAALIGELAEHFERWLLRPAATNVGKPDDSTPERAACGAFLRPAWYTGAMQRYQPWLVCGGMHTPEGWHLTGERDDESVARFASHHWIRRAAGRQCICGSFEFPCQRTSATDMHT